MVQGILTLAAASIAVSLRLPFTSLSGHRDQLEFLSFQRNGIEVAASQIHVRHLGTGLTEILIDGNPAASWEVRLREREPVFGFGERYNALDQSGQVLVNASSDTPGPKGTATYVPMPFFMDLRGYAIWLDTYDEARFDLGHSQPGVFALQLHAARLRLVFIEGPRFPLILERFTGLVGRAQLPPLWAFAPWKSRNWHPDMAAVYEDIDRYRSLGIPASVLVLDSPWATNYNTFAINRQQFTDPETMIRRIHEQGFKLCLWLTAFINLRTNTPSEPELVGKIPLTEASNYEAARSAGYFVHDDSGGVYLADWWKGRGALIDFTNPAATAWWQGQVRQALRLGADAFKADGGEGSFLRGQSAVEPTRYSTLYDRALQAVIDSDLHGDGVLLMRSGSVGNHNLPFFWAGDNAASFDTANGLPSVVLAGLNAGLSGIALWTSDLGGYEKNGRTPGDDTLFVRWTEFSAFSPIMQLHSAINLGPWDYGDRALEIFRDYSRLHMSLFPYRYAAAQEAARTGMPIMRAMVLVDPLDEAARTATDQYYFGPDFLVAPVITPAQHRSVHLPAGDWIDYWTGDRLTGPRDMLVESPINRIPIFVRAGAIIPRIPEDVMTLVPTLDGRRVYDIYPGPARSLRDYEGRRLRVETKGGRSSLRVSGPSAQVTVVWRFQHPAGVRLNGSPVAVRMEGASGSVTFTHSGSTRLDWK